MDRTLFTQRQSNNGGSHVSPAPRGPRLRRWGDSGKVDPAAADAGFELGLTAKAAEHAMGEAFHRAAVFAKHLLAHDGQVRLAHHMAALDAVLVGVGGGLSWKDVIELAKKEQGPDGEEDVAQLALVAANTPENRRAFLRCADREIAALQHLRAAVAAQDGLPPIRLTNIDHWRVPV